MIILVVALALFATALTVAICMNKGWSLVPGIGMGLGLHYVGRLIGTLFVLGPDGDGSGSKSLLMVARLICGLVLPVGVAIMLPRTEGSELDHAGTVCCSECGRVNAVTSRVCPRCGNRKQDPTSSDVASTSPNNGAADSVSSN